MFFYCFLPLFNKNADVVIKMLTLISPVFFSFSFNFLWGVGVVSLLLIKGVLMVEFPYEFIVSDKQMHF